MRIYVLTLARRAWDRAFFGTHQRIVEGWTPVGMTNGHDGVKEFLLLWSSSSMGFGVSNCPLQCYLEPFGDLVHFDCTDLMSH